MQITGVLVALSPAPFPAHTQDPSPSCTVYGCETSLASTTPILLDVPKLGKTLFWRSIGQGDARV